MFIPLLFMTGLVGRMFREFALTLTIAVVVSAIVSLTLTPMMCAKLLRHEHGAGGNRVARWFNGLVEGSVAFYGRSLEWVLRHQTVHAVRDLRHPRWRPSGSTSSCRRASCRCRIPA